MDLTALACCRFKAGNSDKRVISSTAIERTFVAVEVAEVKEVVHRGGGPINGEAGENFVLYEVFESYEIWREIESIVVAEEVEASDLGKNNSTL